MEEKKKLISVVIPCYNEEENVQAMTDTVTRIITSELPEYDYEIIFIAKIYVFYREINL